MISIKLLNKTTLNWCNEHYDWIYGLGNKLEAVEDSVIIFNKTTKQYENKKIFRKYKSFLNTPSFDETTKKSYMFSSQKEKQNYLELPDLLKPIYDDILSLDKRYNNCVVNWYQDGNDWIEMHSDCTAKLLNNSPIAIVTLTNGYPRTLKIVSRGKSHHYTVPLFNGSIIILDNKSNTEYRHGIDPDPTNECSRVSLTFRMVV